MPTCSTFMSAPERWWRRDSFWAPPGRPDAPPELTCILNCGKGDCLVTHLPRWVCRMRSVQVGVLVFRDPILLCGVLYLLLYFDASGFLRLGLLAAVLHELGHIAVYALLRRRLPVIEVTLTGFCMKTRDERFSPGQLFALAAAGPGLADVLWRVICAGETLPVAEKGLGWPARAGRLVLTLALDRVAAHYGLG